jgi:hypothetical protein
VRARRRLAFWDDDNDYLATALGTLAAAARGVDIGIVQCVRWLGADPVSTPSSWEGRFIYGAIDTMCICVRTALARRERWYHRGEARERGTDYRWLTRLAAHRPVVRFVAASVGYHL